MSKHPQRSWAIILQQAWNLRLKDKLKGDHGPDQVGSEYKSKDICKRFNQGKCNLGAACRYKHKCLGCGKFEHGVHICHKKGNAEGGEPRSKPKTPAVSTDNN